MAHFGDDRLQSRADCALDRRCIDTGRGDMAHRPARPHRFAAEDSHRARRVAVDEGFERDLAGQGDPWPVQGSSTSTVVM
jgi:hypothetical protein